MTVGVFDSGIGGLSVAQAIQAALPHLQIVYKNDAEHAPYGTKPLEEIYSYTLPIIKSFEQEECDVVVIACNTVTTNFIERLRQEVATPLIGIEPMVKPAAQATRSGVIAVCATPRTLESKRYQSLKRDYAQNITVLEPDCSDWAEMIDSNAINQEKIEHIVTEVIEQSADQIVLGCTHYHWIAEVIEEAAQGRAAVLQPNQPVIEQLIRVLDELGQ